MKDRLVTIGTTVLMLTGLAFLGFLGWQWWQSRLPASYLHCSLPRWRVRSFNSTWPMM